MPRPSRPQVKDIVVPVLGPTGSGKSTFINHLLGSEQMRVGNHTTSCTTEPYPAYIVPIPFPNLEGYRLVLLDTPGFDDTYEEDSEILKRIANWLAQSRRKGALVGGVLYLHDISTRRFTSAANKHLEMLTRLCGGDGLKKTVMVTTNWEPSTYDELARRESEMTRHWSTILQEGGEVRRFLRNCESAWDILNVLLRCADLQDPLLIQQQLVDNQMSFRETEAGRYSSSMAEKKKSEKKKQERTKRGLCVVQ